MGGVTKFRGGSNSRFDAQVVSSVLGGCRGKPSGLKLLKRGLKSRGVLFEFRPKIECRGSCTRGFGK